MADVFLAVARGPVGFAKLVVVKHIKEGAATEPEFMGMFLDEAPHRRAPQSPERRADERGRDDGEQLHRDGVPRGPAAESRTAERFGRPMRPCPMTLRILMRRAAGLHYAHELADFDGSPSTSCIAT